MGWKPGDVVVLKSGGPQMTVKSLWHDGSVHCDWFDGTKLMTGHFAPESLKKPDEPRI